MKQVPIKLGPLALLLTVISICLTVLAILTFSTARADLRLAEKYADTVSARYALEVQGQAFLRELREADPADLSLLDWERDANGILWKTLEKNGASLRIGVDPRGAEGLEIVAWQQEKQWTQDDHMKNLWTGFGF